MAVLTLILALAALVISIGAVVLILTLPYRQRNAYPGQAKRLADLENYTASELARLAGSQSHLFRYVEKVDAAVGGDGSELRVARVRASQAQFGKLGDH